MRIVTVTLNPCVDRTFTVDALIPDRKLAGRDVRRYPGGGGINVARAIGRLGGEAQALWSAGGATGDLLARLLDAEVVPHRPVPVGEAVRENLIFRDRSDDQQYRIGMPGPELTPEDRDRWRNAVREEASSAEYVVFSGSLPPGASAAWYGELIQATGPNARVIVDTKKEALARALEIGVHLVKPNVHELGEALGRELPDDDRISQAARDLVDRGAAKVVLVSLGRGGALLVTSEGATRFSAPAVPVRSKVGAGDSMVAGVVASLAQGRSVAEAAGYGVAAGAAAVMTEGTELCRREDADRLFARLRRSEEAA